jgi:hypothetical protein
VDDIRLGSADAFGKFLRFCLIEWSDDGTTWTDYDWGDQMQRPQSFGWPGNRTLTTTFDRNGWDLLSVSNMTVNAGDRRVITSTSSSHVARSETSASEGVRQFEIERDSWATLRLVGVWRVEDQTVDTSSEGGWAIRASDGQKSANDAAYTAYTTGGWTASDVFGCVVDFTAGTMTVYKNGVSLGTAFTDMQGTAVRPGITAPSDVETVTLRTNGFTYPIAGAEPWTRAIIAPGAPTVGLSTTVISNGGHELPYSGTIFVPEHRARPNFNFDPTARGRIVGTVKRKSDPTNVPLKRRVRLYRDRDGMFIREGWSNTAGDYVFEYVEENEAYTVLAHDYQFNYRAVVADNLTLANGGVELI